MGEGPNRKTRKMIKKLSRSQYFEIVVDTTLADCADKGYPRERARDELARVLVETVVSSTKRHTGVMIGPDLPVPIMWGSSKSPFLWDRKVDWLYIADVFMDGYESRLKSSKKANANIRTVLDVMDCYDERIAKFGLCRGSSR